MAGGENLGELLGLSTRQQAPFAGMPLTTIANKELTLKRDEDRAERERLKQEAKLDEMLKSRITVPKDYDEISAPKVQSAYANMVKGGYRDPQQAIEYQDLLHNEKLSSAYRTGMQKAAKADKILMRDDVKDAFIKKDQAKLAALADDPTSGVVKDEVTGGYALNEEVPKMDVGKFLDNVIKASSKAEYDLAVQKGIKVGNRQWSDFKANPSQVKNTIDYHLENDDALLKNTYFKHAKEIQAELAKDPNMTPKQAAVNVLYKIVEPNTIKTQETSQRLGRGGITINTFAGSGGIGFDKESWALDKAEDSTPTELKFTLNNRSTGGNTPQPLNVFVKSGTGKKLQDIKGIPLRVKVDKETGAIKIDVQEQDANELVTNEYEIPLSSFKGLVSSSPKLRDEFERTYKNFIKKDVKKEVPKGKIDLSKFDKTK